MALQTVVKQPSELLKKNLAFDTAAAIASIVDVSAAKRNLVPGSSGLVVAGALTAGMLFVTMSGGTDGERYLVTGQVEDADGQSLEAELEVAVIDGAWQTPDGGDGYLSITEFVANFGLDEVVRMTDVAGDGRIDRDLLVNALAAAQALADAYVAARFTVPLVSPPQLVKTIVADLARARLYPNGAPEGVGDAAKAATALLVQIGAGKLQLPGIDAAAETPATDTPAPVVVSPGTRQYGRADFDGWAGLRGH